MISGKDLLGGYTGSHQIQTEEELNRRASGPTLLDQPMGFWKVKKTGCKKIDGLGGTSKSSRNLVRRMPKRGEKKGNRHEVTWQL